MLTVNQTAPEFHSPNQDNQMVSLADFKGKQNVILYFYPKDDTPGCTIEANQFTALANEFAARDTMVIGVSKDDCDSHKAFIAKYGLNVQLLADTSGEVCERYGVWQEKEKDGVKKWVSSVPPFWSTRMASSLMPSMGLLRMVTPRPCWIKSNKCNAIRLTLPAIAGASA